MGIKVVVHQTHRIHTDGLEMVEVEGTVVGECLDNLVERFPGIRNVLFDQNDKLLNYVEIYLNQESTYPEELAKPVKDGDEIHIIVMLAGG